MLPLDDEDNDEEKVEMARAAYDGAVKVARAIYKQLKEQGADNALIHLAGIELSALALDNAEKPAPEVVRMGAISFYAHRVLKGDIPIKLGHPDEDCSICDAVADIRGKEEEDL